MRKLLALVLLALCLPANAEVWQARYGVAETFNFKLYNADGTLDVDEADGGTEVSLSCNEGAETTATNDFVDEGTFYSIALTATEMQCERIAVVIAATTTEVFFIQTSGNASAMTPTYEANVASVTSGAIDNADFATTPGAAGGLFIAGTNAATTVTTSFTTTFTGNLTGSVGSVTGAVGSVTGNVGGNVAGSVGSVTGAVGSVTGNVGGNVTGSVGSVASGGITEASFATTAGSFAPLGISYQGTAQSATGNDIVLAAASTYADNVLEGATIFFYGSTQGYWQQASIASNVLSTDTVTINPNSGYVTPSGTISYKIFGTPAGNTTDVATAVWAAGTRTLTALDEDSTTIDLDASYVGGVTVFDEDLTTIDINATPTGAAASVTGAVGSVTGNVGGNVVGSVASVTAGVTVTTNNDKTGYSLSAGGVDAIWDEPQAGHVTAGTFGLYLDSTISGVSTGGVSAATIADAVWDEALAGHVSAGSAGAAVSDILTDTSTTLDDLVDDLETRLTATRAGYLDNLSGGAVATASGLSTLSTTIGTPAGASVSADIAAIEAQTDDIGVAGIGLTALPWNAAWDAEVQSEVTDALNALTLSEPAAVPTWGSSTLAQWVAWIGAWSRNEVQQTSTTKTLRNDADNAAIATCAVSDDGTTFQVSECQ